MTSLDLHGKTVTLCGTFPGTTHGALKTQLVALGAHVTGTVSNKTDLVFVGNKGGAKQRKAETLGIPIHPSNVLFALFAGDAPSDVPDQPPSNGTDNTTAPEASEPVAEASADPASEFAGLTIAVTGKFVTMKRADASKLLTEAGAKVGGSVTKKTDLLIYGERAGSKLSKARTLGIRLLTEAEFIDILNRSTVQSDLLEGASDQIAKAEAAERKRTRAVRKAIDPILTAQRERWGVTLGQLLLKYIQVLSLRPDVHAYDVKIGAPLGAAGLVYYHKNAPAEWLALASEVNALEFNWVLADRKAQRQGFSKGYNGGRIALDGFPSTNYRLWYAIPEWRKEYESYKAEANFDSFVAEGRTVYSYDPGRRPHQATLIFDNANDCERHPLGSLEDYITSGARDAFVWYWQMGDWEGASFKAELLSKSVPPDTDRATLEGLLQDKGLTKAEAHGLLEWLGDDVVILLHGSETPEGKQRMQLTTVFSGYGEPSERSMDHALIRSLTEGGDRISDSAWAGIVESHRAFLASGGTGGSWTPLSASGLPLCLYQGAQATEGEQAVLRLKNFDGRDASGVDLSWADLSGAHAVGVCFARANLSHSMAIDSVLDGADFTGANLASIDLSGTSLRGTVFRQADLSRADFEATDLTGADFTGAILTDARFPGAILDDVTFDAP